MILPPPISSLTDTLFPSTTLFLSDAYPPHLEQRLRMGTQPLRSTGTFLLWVAAGLPHPRVFFTYRRSARFLGLLPATGFHLEHFGAVRTDRMGSSHAVRRRPWHAVPGNPGRYLGRAQRHGAGRPRRLDRSEERRGGQEGVST